MAMGANIFLILMIANYGSAQSLLYASPMKSSQGFQRQSLGDYYEPSLELPKRQHLFGNEAADRWLINDNDEEGISNAYTYGNKGQLRFEDSGNRPTIKNDVGFGLESRDKRKTNRGIELFVRPQDPRRTDFPVFFKKAVYDVPQVECPKTKGGYPRFACPSADKLGRYRCITDHHLCDGFIDCPLAEDEDQQSCMFYKMTRAQVNFLAEVMMEWIRSDSGPRSNDRIRKHFRDSRY